MSPRDHPAGTLSGTGDDDRIHIPKAAELVSNTLRRRIINGDHTPGELLPPEGTLMRTFNVGRTTIRDAFRILESEGWLVVRRGGNGGGRVQVPSVGMVANHAGVVLQFRGTTLEDVHTARIMLETPVAGMLAERSDDAEMLGELRHELDLEAEALDDTVALTRAEGRFHQRLVQLAGSRTLEMLCAVANQIIAQQVARALAERGGGNAGHRRYRDAHRAHQRLVDLIAVGAVREAETLWRRHLESGLEHLLGTAPSAAVTVVDVMT